MSMRWTKEELDAYHARKPDLMEYEAERQARRKPKLVESRIQIDGVRMAREAMQLAGIDPRLLFSVPNGADVADSHRNRLVQEGMTAGCPDLFLAYADVGDDGYTFMNAGLWIEVKSATGKLSEAQHNMLKALEDAGYVYQICRSAAEIRDTVIDYLGIDSPSASRDETGG